MPYNCSNETLLGMKELDYIAQLISFSTIVTILKRTFTFPEIKGKVRFNYIERYKLRQTIPYVNQNLVTRFVMNYKKTTL